MIYRHLLLLFIFITSNCCFSQSYNRAYNLTESFYLYINHMAELSDGDVIATGFYFNYPFGSAVCKFNPSGDLYESYSIFPTESNNTVSAVSGSVEDTEGNIYILHFCRYGNIDNDYHYFLTKFSNDSDLLWSKELTADFGDFLGEITSETGFLDHGNIFIDNNIITIVAASRQGVELFQTDTEGNLIKNKSLAINLPDWPELRYTDIWKIDKYEDNFYLSFSHRLNSNNSRESFLLILNANELEIVNVVSFPNELYRLAGIFASGDLLMTDTGYFHNGQYRLFRITPEGVIGWSYEYTLSFEIQYSFANAIVSSENEIFISFTLGNGANGIMRLNADGEFTEGLGFEGGAENHGFKSTIIETSDQRLLFATLLNSDASSTTNMFTKINPNGEFGQTSPRIICINDPADFTVTTATRTFIESETGSIIPAEVMITPLTFEEVEIPEFILPNPEFTFPDTLCVEENASPDSSVGENANAQSIEWYVEAGDPENIEGTFAGTLNWSEPGTYTIRKTIYFDNCPLIYEHRVTVIPAPAAELDSSDVLCAPDETLSLSVFTFDTLQYSWNTGDTTGGITVNTPGIYAVTVDNGQCQTTAAVEVFDMSPEFNMPSRICQDQCTAPTGLQNTAAEEVLWEFGGGTPAVSTQADPGQVCYPEPGTYLVRQTITADDCTEVFEKTVVITPDPQPDLGADRALCPEASLTLAPTTEHADDYTYTWSTGEETESIVTATPGVYAVTVSNEECTGSDTVAVMLVDLPAEPLRLPPDTVLCARDFPYLLTAEYAAGGNLLWENGVTEATRTVNAPGIFATVLTIAGCTFYADIDLSSEDCRRPIYFPTAFSPNSDGINDTFGGLGREVEVTELRIYDRWGNLLFFSETGEFWNGFSAAGAVDNGVYVYTAIYRNLRTGEEFGTAGEVTVLK